eukprot:jgi/Picsp_1/2839/NSC_01065-R1_---NA---
MACKAASTILWLLLSLHVSEVLGYGGICLDQSYWVKDKSFTCSKSDKSCKAGIQEGVKSSKECCGKCGADWSAACRWWSFQEPTKTCIFFFASTSTKILPTKSEVGTISSSIGQSEWFDNPRGTALFGTKKVLVTNHNGGGSKSTITACNLKASGGILSGCRRQKISSQYGDAFALAVDQKRKVAFFTGRKDYNGLLIGCKVTSTGQLKSCQKNKPGSDGPYWNSVSDMAIGNGYLFALNAGSSVKKQGWLSICKISGRKISSCSDDILYGDLGIATGIVMQSNNVFIGHSSDDGGHVMQCALSQDSPPTLTNCKDSKVQVDFVGGIGASESKLFVTDRNGDTLSVCDKATSIKCSSNNDVGNGNTNYMKMPGDVIFIPGFKVLVANTGVADSIATCDVSGKSPSCTLASLIRRF